MQSSTCPKDGLNNDSRAANASSNGTDPVIALEMFFFSKNKIKIERLNGNFHGLIGKALKVSIFT